jgi:hypothetical protein
VRSLGEAAWSRFLRWSLTDGDHAVAAGAALLLHQAGEKRVQVLREVLLNALHDGGYVRRAEEVLSTLLAQDRDRSLRWLAHHLGKSQGLNGGHSGWWRILLSLLDADAPDGPDILRGCMAGVGPFLLARYPEVRDRLSRLLSGASGERFRKALREQLWHPDPQVRHGTASVLLTCDPAGEGEALFVTVAGRGRLLSYDHEWEAFCLSLAFGSTVLEGLHGRLDRLHRAGRALALVILRRHHHPLSAQEQEELFGHLLELGNRSLASSVVGDADRTPDEWFRFLRRRLEQPVDDRGRRAADWLLRGFQQKLSPEETGRCRVWSCLGNLYDPSLLEEETARILTDEVYRTGLRSILDDAARFLGHPSVLERVSAAATAPEAWQEVLWDLLCDDKLFFLETEDGGQFVLDFGRAHADHAPAIGAAAVALLRDARLGNARRPESLQWLALLADEFGSLAAEEITRVLVAGSPISWAAARALMARLGTSPPAMPRRRYAGDCPVDLGAAPPPQPVAAPVAALVEYGRSGGGLHLGTCAAVLELLCSPTVEEGDLRKIACQGVPGILIAEALRFLAGYRPCLADRVPLFDSGCLHYFHTDGCFQRLRRTVVLAHALALEEDATARESYLCLLDEELASNRERIAPLAIELLRHRGALQAQQVRPVFEDFALHEGMYQAQLSVALVHWISSLGEEPLLELVASAAEHGLQVLRQQGPVVRGEPRSPYSLLLFPLIVWGLRHRSDSDSIEVYWCGMKQVFSLSTAEHGRTHSLEILEEVGPLLSRVPPAVWEAVREAGASYEDSTVRSLIVLLGGFTGGSVSTYPSSPPGVAGG